MDGKTKISEAFINDGENSSKEIRRRKYESILRITGAGVVVFGLWSFAKVMIHVLFDFEHVEEMAGYEFTNESKILLFVILVIIMAFDIMFRLYICKSAINEAKGKKTSSLYLVFSILIVIVTIGLSPSYFTDYEFDLEMIAGIITDVTSVIITVELICSAILIKRCKKEESEGKTSKA